MSTVLKLVCQGQVHRVILQDVSCGTIWDTIRQVYPDSAIIAKYMDEDGDLCSLYPGSLSDFVAHGITQRDGRTVLKLELVLTAVENEADPAAVPKATMPRSQKVQGKGECDTWMRGSSDRDSPMAHFLHAGSCALKMFWSHFQFGHHGFHYGWKGKGGCLWGWSGTPKKLIFVLAQLRRSGALNQKSFASLFVSSLPELSSFVVEHPDLVDWKVKRNMPALTRMLEDLRQVVASTNGLDKCEVNISAVLTGSDISASAMLSDLLLSLFNLPFESQVGFFEALYLSLGQKLDAALNGVERRLSWMPAASLVHAGITCDGCEKHPVIGLRFKCKQCPDYDLCGDCFASKGLIHAGDCSHHNFDLNLSEPLMACHEMCKSKGKAAGKGMCKGKSYGKRKLDESGIESNQELSQPPFDFTFPVVVEDGRHLSIAWNRKDSLHSVAARFAMQHGIQSDELPIIRVFLEQASSIAAGILGKEERPVTMVDDPSSTERVVDNRGKALNEAQEHLAQMVLAGGGGSSAGAASDLVLVDTTMEVEPPIGFGENEKEERGLMEAQRKLEAMGIGDAQAPSDLLKEHDESLQKDIEALSGWELP